MQVHLQNLLPVYFPDSRKQNSEVWGRELRFNRGERIKIVAPSGSGKTSLMHFLYGLRNDYNGSLAYNNKLVKNFSAEDFDLWR